MSLGDSRSWAGAMFGKIFSDDFELELGVGLNFGGGLAATLNPETLAIDVVFVGGGGELPEAGAAGSVLISNGSAWIAGALDLADSDARTGLLPVTSIVLGSTFTVLGSDGADNFFTRISDAYIDAAAAIAYSKFANLAGAGLLGATAAGPVVEISLNATLEFNTGALRRAALTGDVTAAAGSNTTAIAAGVIVNADVNAAAAIAGTKIAPDFGSQAVVTTSTITGNELRALQDSADVNPAEITGRKAGGGGALTPDGASIVYFQAERCTGSSTFVEAGGVRFVYDFADPENSLNRIVWTEVRSFDSQGVATVSRTGELQIAIDDDAAVQVMSFAIASGEQVEIDIDVVVSADTGGISHRFKRTWSAVFVSVGGVEAQWGSDVEKFALALVGDFAGGPSDATLVPGNNYVQLFVQASDEADPIPSTAHIVAAVRRLDLGV